MVSLGVNSLVAEETNLAYKADVAVKVYCKSGLKADMECRKVLMGRGSRCKSNTTVNEKVYNFSVQEGVTSIGSYLESLYITGSW